METEPPHRTRATYVLPAPPRWVDAVLGDGDRARSAMLNQIVVTSVVLIVALTGLLVGFRGDTGMFFLAVTGVFVLSGAAIIVPWGHLPQLWLILIPVGDVVAVAVMRVAEPTGGFGLLWVFPVIWLAAGFGTLGWIGGVAVALAAYGTTEAIIRAAPSSFGFLLLPLLLIAVSTSTYLSSRRANAQRLLLDRQATVLTQSLERARRHEQVLTEALDRVDFGVARIETDGSASIINDAHARLLRGSRTSGMPDIYSADGSTLLMAEEHPLARVRRGEAFTDARMQVGSDDSRRVLSVSARRIIEPDGRDSGAVVVTRDVTAETDASRERDALVSSVSHELRTPLTSILGYLELAIDTPGVPEAALENLRVADRNADQLLRLVGDVLAASSQSKSAAQLTVAPADIDLVEIVNAAVESILVSAGERGIAIDVSRVEPARAYADPVRIRQVLDNLLSNAVKYNRPRGRVSVATSVGDQWALIAVQDSGVGLNEEDLGSVFQRYYRGAAVRDSSVSGSGLGLAISRDIVRRHGGDITVSSVLGVGSTFSVTLPARRPGSPAS
ncbi:cell wall metabolism sensor histidine kinase WalK [Microbacterium sp. cf332]|uniref:sensor histidine kinase n=1 Tax=Microbacterium sp. cf332 TaxID=1761804 RepID=UPI000885972F|nr:PAS domain-containing sensor histidine kinase [Microbacterium sp. cf332]SDQ17946.1 His Kinase A (phospho-acceptor) domain-containing protein [Microbacterium sp. cf332]